MASTPDGRVYDRVERSERDNVHLSSIASDPTGSILDDIDDELHALHGHGLVIHGPPQAQLAGQEKAARRD